MNYRHAFHAGNFADVFKHILLSRILIYLTRKPAPLRYIETHAGIGRYDLASALSARTGEWRDGIGRLTQAAIDGDALPLMRPYLDMIGPYNVEGRPKSYPGSPIVAQRLSRRQDRLLLCELNSQDAEKLAVEMRPDPRVKTLHIDGYVGLGAFVPPPERRGLVFVDPPFEERDELTRTEVALMGAYRKWESGTYAVWYPLKHRLAGESLCNGLLQGGLSRLLRLEFAVDHVTSDGPLAGCGLVVVNPPFTLLDEARIILPALVQVLRRSDGAMHREISIGL